MSAAVLQELTTGSRDAREVSAWRLMEHGYENRGALLVPTGEEWWQAGKVLNALLRGEKRKSGGRTPKLASDEKNRLVRNILVAVTVKRANALLETLNVKDFRRIARYCRVRVLSGKDHFADA